MNLTKDQAIELAKHYSGMAMSVAKYRYEHWNELSPTRRQELSDQHWSLANDSDDFIKLSSSLIMDDAQRDLNKIKSLTAQIIETIDNLKAVQKLIDIIAAVLELGGSIIAKDPSSIIKKIKSLESVLTSPSLIKKKKHV